MIEKRIRDIIERPEIKELVEENFNKIKKFYKNKELKLEYSQSLYETLNVMLKFYELQEEYDKCEIVNNILNNLQNVSEIQRI